MKWTKVNKDTAHRYVVDGGLLSEGVSTLRSFKDKLRATKFAKALSRAIGACNLLDKEKLVLQRFVKGDSKATFSVIYAS